MGGTSRACRLRLTCQTGTSACWPNNWSPRRWAGASRVASDGETRLEAVLTMEMDAGIRDVAWNGEAGLTTRPVVRAIVEIMIGRRFNVDCRVGGVPQRCSAAPIPQRHPRRCASATHRATRGTLLLP